MGDGVSDMMQRNEGFPSVYHQREWLLQEVKRLNAIINSPHNDDFLKGVSVEAEHQRQRWSQSHDGQKNGWDWFWTIGYLSQKAATAFEAGDYDKAKHHCISTAALMKTMHRYVSEHEASSMEPSDGLG